MGPADVVIIGLTGIVKNKFKKIKKNNSRIYCLSCLLSAAWRHSAYLRHATLKSAQCRYRRAAGTPAEIFPHYAATDFLNFTFTFQHQSNAGLSIK